MYRNHRAIPSQAPQKLCICVGNILILVLTLFLIVTYWRYRYIFRSRRLVSKDVVPKAKVPHFPDISLEQDYERMEKELKVYIYRDRGPGIYFLRYPREVTGMYGSEAYFFKNVKESRFLTTNPLKAHFFFIPISWHQMRSLGTPCDKMILTVENYVQTLISKYPFWNRTQGADHFFVICHHIGVEVIEGVPLLKNNSIRLVCPVSYDTHYIPYKDISLPQVNQSIFSHPASRSAMLNRSNLKPKICKTIHRILNPCQKSYHKCYIDHLQGDIHNDQLHILKNPSRENERNSLAKNQQQRESPAYITVPLYQK